MTITLRWTNRLAVSKVLKYDGECNLISANLNLDGICGGAEFEHVPPDELVSSIKDD